MFPPRHFVILAGLTFSGPARAQVTMGGILANYAGIGVGFAPEDAGAWHAGLNAAPAACMTLRGRPSVVPSGPFLEMNLLDTRDIQAAAGAEPPLRPVRRG